MTRKARSVMKPAAVRLIAAIILVAAAGAARAADRELYFSKTAHQPTIAPDSHRFESIAGAIKTCGLK